MLNYKKKIAIKNIDSEITNIFKNLEELKTPSGFSQFILYTLSEIFANINEHARTKSVFIEIKVDSANCLLRVRDNGIGLRHSYLSKKIYPKDNFAAIEFALSGLSTKNPKERGFGLYTIRKFTEALKGQMQIETEDALALVEKNKINFKKSLKKIKGLAISICTKVQEVDFYKFIE